MEEKTIQQKETILVVESEDTFKIKVEIAFIWMVFSIAYSFSSLRALTEGLTFVGKFDWLIVVTVAALNLVQTTFYKNHKKVSYGIGVVKWSAIALSAAAIGIILIINV